jgi:hypothetical protein
MDEPLSELAEETFPQSLRRRYTSLSAWLLRLNRLPEPSRVGGAQRAPNRPEKSLARMAPFVNNDLMIAMISGLLAWMITLALRTAFGN